VALREIRILGDDLLRKKSREVEVVDDRIRELVKDMIETMVESEGVGLAAPQIGILKRIVIVMDGKKIIPLINPKIIEQEGKCIDYEGCLSVKNKNVKVSRPEKIRVQALDVDGNELDFVAMTLGNHEYDWGEEYIKANADMLLQDNEAQIISATSQANALSEKSNTELIKLVNTLTGSKYDIGSEKFASMINDFAQKLSANISISNNLITFDI